MPPTVATETVTMRNVRRISGTRSAVPEALLSADPEREKNLERWGELIRLLVEWECSTESVEDGDSIPPSAESIAVARALALKWKNNPELQCPLGVVPNGDGGVLFHVTKTAEDEFSINVLEDGSVDCLSFRGRNLIERRHHEADSV